MVEATLKVGVVGLRRGQGLVNALAMHPRLEISAVCDTDPAVLTQLGDEFDLPSDKRCATYDALVSTDVDIIVIATPIEFHAEQSIKALDAGKHVLSEQTQAYTIEDCQAIIDAERRSGKVYMMAENYTYFHYMEEWKRRIDNNELGEITYAEGEYVHEIVDLMVDPVTGEHEWRYTRPAIYYCAHSLGPLLTLTNDRVIRATGVHSGKKAFPDEPGEGFLDMEVALFQTEKGRIIKILRSQVAPRYHKGFDHLVWYSITGTKGFIESGRDGSRSTTGLFFGGEGMDEACGAIEIACNTSDPSAPAGADSGGHGTSEYVLVREFCDAIDSGRRASIDSIRASDFTIPGIIAHESAKQGGVWLDVPRLS